MEIQPGATPVRIRGLQNHDSSVESVQRGQRAAINIAGVHHDEISRGHELAAKQHLESSQLITARLNLLASSPRPLKNRATIRAHVGTAEVLARVALLDGDRLEPGQTGLAQLYLREPIATVWQQPLVLRCESPMFTIGGGHVLVPAAQKIKRLSDTERQRLEELQSDDENLRVAAALYFHELRSWEPSDLLRLAGISNGAVVEQALIESGGLVPLVVSPTRTAHVERGAFQKWSDRICTGLERLHTQFPLRSSVERSQLRQRFEYVGDNQLLEALLRHMASEKILKLSDTGIALASHKPKLSERQQEMLAQIVERFEAGGMQPPAAADCYDLHPKQPKEIDKLVNLAVSDGQLVHISQGFFLHTAVEQAMREQLREALASSEGMTLSAIRELLGTTRKYAVPLCEYLDKSGFTKRNGDLRFLGSS
jgi:selenocysteine-specific elongation factor